VFAPLSKLKNILNLFFVFVRLCHLSNISIYLLLLLIYHKSKVISYVKSTNMQTSIWNLGSDACFKYTSCYFKVVTFFIRNLFRVRLPYLLLIRSLWAKNRYILQYYKTNSFSNFLTVSIHLNIKLHQAIIVLRFAKAVISLHFFNGCPKAR
jgi:hypothetical protein